MFLHQFLFHFLTRFLQFPFVITVICISLLITEYTIKSLQFLLLFVSCELKDMYQEIDRLELEELAGLQSAEFEFSEFDGKDSCEHKLCSQLSLPSNSDSADCKPASSSSSSLSISWYISFNSQLTNRIKNWRELSVMLPLQFLFQFLPFFLQFFVLFASICVYLLMIKYKSRFLRFFLLLALQLQDICLEKNESKLKEIGECSQLILESMNWYQRWDSALFAAISTF